MLSTKEILKETIQNSYKVLHIAKQFEINYTSEFCLTMLTRLNDASQGLSLLVGNIREYFQLDYPNGTILRTTILDHLIDLNIYKEVINCNVTELEKKCKDALADSIYYS